jgi:septal ring factor EnvC (AmiA/AmiB activator)
MHVEGWQAAADRTSREITALRRLVLVALAAVAIAMVLAVWQAQELSRVRGQIGRLQTALTAEADRRMQTLTPQLEERAQRIEASAARADKSMQELDGKINAAGDRIADQAVQRFEQRLPALIDQYLMARIPR